MADDLGYPLHRAKPAYDVVVFYPHAILPQMDGAQARAGEMLDRLTAELPSVALYSFDNDPQHPWTAQKKALFAQRWPQIDLVTEPWPKSVKYLSYLKKIMLGVFPFKAGKILSLKIKGRMPEFERIREASPTFIINYQKGLCELNGVDPAQCFVETLDLHFLKMAKVHHKSPFSAGSLLKLRAELGAYNESKGLFAISPIEATFFRMLLPEVPTYFISSWTLPPPYRRPAMVREADFDLIFVGSAYQMNARGLCALYETDGGWLSRYRVAVCGKVCDDPAVIALAGRFETITLLGYVEDLDDVLRRARAALSPVSGTGVKMKILAAIRAGLPVLASRASMEGLAAGYEGAVLEIGEDACRRLLGDAAAYETARQAAVAYGTAHALAGESDAAITAIKRAVQKLPLEMVVEHQ